MTKYFLAFAVIISVTYRTQCLSVPETNTTEALEDRISCEMLTSSSHCVKLGRKFYLIDPNHLVNWFEAERQCLQQNTRLAVIENDAEMAAINEYLSQAKFRDNGPFDHWLGANNLGSARAFHEIKTGKPLKYVHWGENQPDNWKQQEHCMCVYRAHNKLYMNDINCESRLRFICEFYFLQC